MLTLALALALAADPLPVPADALAVVQVRGLGHVRTQLAGLVAAVTNQKADEFAFQFDALLMADAWAVDPTRRGWLAVLPINGGVTWAAWLPTRRPDRFRSALQATGSRLHLLDRPGYSVITPSEPAAKRLAADPKPFTLDGMGDAAELFLGSDLGLFVNLPEVQARYGGLLMGTRFALPGLLRSGAFGLPKLDARQSAQVAAVADGVIQAVVDGRGFAVGVNLGPSGVTVEAALGVRPDTVAAKVLAGERPSTLPLLNAMPGGQSAYAAGRFGVELARRLRTTFPEAMPADPLATWASHGWASAGLAPAPVLEVCQPELPEHWLGLVRAGYERAEFAQNLPLKEKSTWLRQAVACQGRVFDRLRLTFDLPAATAAIADEGIRQAAHVTMKGLVGERSDQWLALDGNHGLRVSAADWPAARTLVDAFLADGGKAGDDPLVKAIRDRLPAEASAVVLLDAARFTCLLGGLARGAVDELPAFPGLDLPEFVPPAGRSPFLGLALVTRPLGGRATLVLPADALRASLDTVRQNP